MLSHVSDDAKARVASGLGAWHAWHGTATSHLRTFSTNNATYVLRSRISLLAASSASSAYSISGLSGPSSPGFLGVCRP